jgi:ribonucleoside-triphosphate reductase
MPERRVPVEVFSRVVGYFRPINQWNKGKREEFNERNTFNINSDYYNEILQPTQIQSPLFIERKDEVITQNDVLPER